jgi:hypothetical protein
MADMWKFVERIHFTIFYSDLFMNAYRREFHLRILIHLCDHVLQNVINVRAEIIKKKLKFE